jgi:hypothetical protein
MTGCARKLDGDNKFLVRSVSLRAAMINDEMFECRRFNYLSFGFILRSSQMKLHNVNAEEEKEALIHCRAGAIPINIALKKKKKQPARTAGLTRREIKPERNMSSRWIGLEAAVLGWRSLSERNTACPPLLQLARPQLAQHSEAPAPHSGSAPPCVLRVKHQTPHAICHTDKGQYQCNLLQRAAVPPSIAPPEAHLQRT